MPAVSVFGLGYVGCVSAVCLAARGHRVVGVDVNSEKLELLGRGEAPIVEEGIGELTAEVVANGALTVSADVRAAVMGTDVSLICVGTPSASGGALSTAYLVNVTDQIGAALADKDGWHVVAYRSTMLPGTCEGLLIPRLNSGSQKRAGVDFGVCVNPEFLREGTSIRDFNSPPKTVVGQTDTDSGDLVMNLYQGLPGPRFHVPIRIAEMTKYVDNSFHALKVAFANEVGVICSALGIDSHELMDIFSADTKLNISPEYLRPGFAFGGSCLPKDVRAITHTARQHGLEVPLLTSVLSSNEAHIRRVIDMIPADGRRKVGIFGLSFKPGTDDLRESPMVEVVQRLIDKGFDVKIHDSNVVLSRLIGANRSFISEQLPHIGDLLTADPGEVVDHGDVVVVGSRSDEVVNALKRVSASQLVIDLVRLPNADEPHGNYRGVGW